MKEKTKIQILFGLAIAMGGLSTPAYAGASVTPVPVIPEPSSLLLFAAGFAVTAMAVRMARRK